MEDTYNLQNAPTVGTFKIVQASHYFIICLKNSLVGEYKTIY